MDYRRCSSIEVHPPHHWESEYPRQTPESPPLTRTFECYGVAERCPKCRHAPHDGQRCLNMASDNDCSCDLRTSQEDRATVAAMQEAMASVPVVYAGQRALRAVWIEAYMAGALRTTHSSESEPG